MTDKKSHVAEYGDAPVLFISQHQFVQQLFRVKERYTRDSNSYNLSVEVDITNQQGLLNLLENESILDEVADDNNFEVIKPKKGATKIPVYVLVQGTKEELTSIGDTTFNPSLKANLPKVGLMAYFRSVVSTSSEITKVKLTFVGEARANLLNSVLVSLNKYEDFKGTSVLFARDVQENLCDYNEKHKTEDQFSPNQKTFIVKKLITSLNTLLKSESFAGLYDNLSERDGQYEVLVYAALMRVNPMRSILDRFLQEDSLYGRYIFLIAHIEFLLKRVTFETELQETIRKAMETNQRRYFITEQIRALKRELDPKGDGDEGEGERFLAKLESLNIQDDYPEIYARIRLEINRLDSLSSGSQEYSMQRSYVDWLLKTPYHGDKLKTIDLVESREILDSDHYGLDEVKERVLEYLAVLSRVHLTKAPVLCLIGPPGVGKTSLGKSIASATGRKYTRWALGGISDEGEIRGHRRTYIGAQPGKVINHLAKLGVNNPLFLLDEIDKLTSNHRGDPAAALLEVLDPEQNVKFVDNYLEIDYDLSKVLFIATANSYNIPPALLDRMEVVDLGSYTRDEKFQIAKQHIVSKLLRRNGVDESEITLPDDIINFIIDGYTNEAGVRSLERRIERIIRRAIKDIVEGKAKHINVTRELVIEILGPMPNESAIEQSDFRSKSIVGQITGLAWTASGGDVLPIEAAVTSGKGEILSTGSLGDQIKESIRAAITVIRQRAIELGIAEDFYSKNDFHVHFPNAGINKDGPSAGSAITTCLISALTKKPIAMDIGMTGEISIHGNVLRIGGVKEKVISAHRNGVKHIILPKTNEADLVKVPESIKAELQFYPVETIDEVLDIVFGDKKRPTKSTLVELEAKEFIQAEKKIELEEVALDKPKKVKKTTSEKSTTSTKKVVKETAAIKKAVKETVATKKAAKTTTSTTRKKASKATKVEDKTVKSKTTTKNKSKVKDSK